MTNPSRNQPRPIYRDAYRIDDSKRQLMLQEVDGVDIEVTRYLDPEGLRTCSVLWPTRVRFEREAWRKPKWVARRMNSRFHDLIDTNSTFRTSITGSKDVEKEDSERRIGDGFAATSLLTLEEAVREFSLEANRGHAISLNQFANRGSDIQHFVEFFLRNGNEGPLDVRVSFREEQFAVVSERIRMAMLRTLDRGISKEDALEATELMLLFVPDGPQLRD